MKFYDPEEFARLAADVPDAPTTPRLPQALPLGLAPPPQHKPRAGVARSLHKQQAWRSQVDRTYAWLDSVATSALDRQSLEAAYRSELNSGPDFTRVRRGSDFTTRKAADRSQLDDVMREFLAVDRNTFQADRATAAATGRPFRRTIPSRAEKVLRALVALARRHDAVFPSLARIASMAQCSRRTAVRIVAVLQELGFVRVHRRRKRISTALGARQVQDTSSYQIQHPKTANGFGAMISKLFGQSTRSECNSGTAMIPPHTSNREPSNLVPIRPRKARTGRLNLWEFEPT